MGKIIRIAGSLVEADGMKGCKIYELVKVGNEKLLGEIIRLNRDVASIQVYEETDGISPGEPVEGTGSPLSVELGPGILKSIYDGVQRPLELIQKESGEYIARGVSVPPIDDKKKWKFTPKVKKGQDVEGGDVIGEIPETDIVMHKVMAPPGVAGKVQWVAKAGKYTCREVLCKVKGGGKVHNITASQRWPIRKLRPAKKKLAPEVPLVTGQRILDTFFPLAKGGTAAIPGGFGTGKCVPGETPLLLADGTVKEIGKVYDENEGNGRKLIKSRDEFTLLDRALSVFSLNSGKLKEKPASAVYRGKASKIYRIRTKTGRKMEVTPIHKLFALTPELKLQGVESRKLKVGDYLAVPRKLKFKGKKQGINIMGIERLESERVCDPKILEDVPKLIERVTKEKNITKKELSDKLSVSNDVLIGYFLKKNKPTLKFVKKLYNLAKKPVKVTRIKGERASKTVMIPKQFDKDFAEFVGLLLGDGSLKQRFLAFYNNDESLLRRFEELSMKLFGLEAKRSVANTVKCSLIKSSVVVKLLEWIGMPGKQKSRNCSVPDIVMRSENDVVGTFLGAYFNCDGHVGAGGKELEITTASKLMVTGLSYLLLRFGVLHSLAEKTVNKRPYYGIYVRGKDEVKTFHSSFTLPSNKFKLIERYLKDGKKGYTSTDVVPVSPSVIKNAYDSMGNPRTGLAKEGITIQNYIYNDEKMTSKTFKKFAEMSDAKNMKVFAECLDHVFFDKIVDIEEINWMKDVYDITVPGSHNFVGGFGPSLLHNTVTQHQLAKWADADIIIYVGCGERGNEMCEVLQEFPELEDPKTGKPLMERSVLIANTSNMPVAAREASVYTGITIAEYYRDMGYDTAVMADSTSRWAEAMREISSRLEEMPGEEGYPAHLASRLAEFYERAGSVITLGSGKERKGSVSIIGAVSPPGGDFSEPVTQNTLKITRVFWALDSTLADRRHFPAINWLTSYSLYQDHVRPWLEKNVEKGLPATRREAMRILQKESELKEIVQLVGPDALPENERLLLEVARMIREDFLQQSAFHEVDTYCPLERQFRMLEAILNFHEKASNALGKETTLDDIMKLEVIDKIARMKEIGKRDFDKRVAEINREVNAKLG